MTISSINSHSRDSKIQYLRAIAIERGYSPSIIDTALRKLQQLRPSNSNQSSFLPRSSIVLPFFPKSSFPIAKILRQHDFRIIFTPANKLTFSKLKDPIELYNSWGIYSINCQCGLSYVGQTKRGLKFRIKEHQQYIQKQETNKSSIAKHCWEMNHCFDFNSAKIISKPTSIHEHNFLEAFHICKNYDNIVNSEFAIPPLSDCWKYFIKSSFA